MTMYIYCVFVDLVFNISLHQGAGDGGWTQVLLYGQQFLLNWGYTKLLLYSTQYMYIVILYITVICVRALETGRKRAFSKLFWSDSQWVQMNYIFLPTMFILQCHKVQNKRQISLKGTETIFLRQKDNRTSNNLQNIKKKTKHKLYIKPGGRGAEGVPRCSGMVSSSCSTEATINFSSILIIITYIGTLSTGYSGFSLDRFQCNFKPFTRVLNTFCICWKIVINQIELFCRVLCFC
jgi:uncharacterized membrane protein YhdT